MARKSSAYITLNELCKKLSISDATGRNWVRLGKVEPSFVDDKKGPMFASSYVSKLEKDLSSGKNTALKSRRNKKYVSGNSLYNSYVSSDCRSLESIQKLLERVEESGIEPDSSMIRVLCADCARKILADAGREGDCAELVDELLGDGVSGSFGFLSDIEYYYEPGEDVLGLLYISCKNLGKRKAAGAYYTPNKVVRKLVDTLDICGDIRLLDPCCGTGNFLLQLPEAVKLENIYGNDLDPVSVMIARINLALKFTEADVKTLKEHVTCRDYLFDNDIAGGSFDLILGNPPWGYEFSDSKKNELRQRFGSASGKNIESYDVFTEKALSDLKRNGVLSFVLPEAILNVKAHKAVRKLILKSCDVTYAEYLGDVFAGVQCPSIIMNIRKTEKELSTKGLRVRDGKRGFVIKTEREMTEDNFCFNITDEEYSILQKVTKSPKARFLLHNADFALGIVTGNNKKYLSKEKGTGFEPVLKGSDIGRYYIEEPSNFMAFKPKSFQQVAPTQLYRADEKLFYRFISDRPVFAYDDKKLLSLNSCNIVIPRLEGLSVKYVLAVLNSSISEFVYVRQFASVKVLRSHIESIPIPEATPAQQQKITALVDELIAGGDKARTKAVYDEIDELVFDLFGLTKSERKAVKQAF